MKITIEMEMEIDGREPTDDEIGKILTRYISGVFLSEDISSGDEFALIVNSYQWKIMEVKK